MVALLEARRRLPDDVHAWLAGALARVLNGDDVADVFGASRSARLRLRDDRLRELAALAPGGVTSKARTVETWLRSGDAPPAAAPLLREVRDRPGWRQILRVLRGSRSGDVSEPGGFDTAAPDAAISAWLQRGSVRKVPQ